MKIILVSMFCIFPSIVFAGDFKCEAGKILISGHYVKSYVRKNGMKVKGYFRDQYCRTSTIKAEELIFSDDRPADWPSGEKFKVWSKEEIEVVLQVLEEMPDILKKQFINTFHRGLISRILKNPAANIPLSNSIILYNKFFNNPEKSRILAHEIAHFWYWRLTSEQKMMFAAHTGWSYNPNTKVRLKSMKGIYPDSMDGPGEDFANNAEAYFYDKKFQSEFDIKLQEFFSNLIKDDK